MERGEISGVISGDSARDRAVAIAGLLAELGVSSLRLCSGGRVSVLHARVTDLPAEIVSAAPCELDAMVGGEAVGFRVTEAGAEWRASPGLAERIVKLGGRAE